MPISVRKTPKDKVAASLTVYGAPDFTKRGRREIAAWLRARARDVENHADGLSSVFRARFMYAVRTRRKKKK